MTIARRFLVHVRLALGSLAKCARPVHLDALPARTTPRYDRRHISTCLCSTTYRDTCTQYPLHVRLHRSSRLHPRYQLAATALGLHPQSPPLVPRREQWLCLCTPPHCMTTAVCIAQRIRAIVLSVGVAWLQSLSVTVAWLQSRRR